MGVDELEVTLDAPSSHIFRSGDIVTGNVKFAASSDVVLDEGIAITRFEAANVQWNEPNGQTSTRYSNTVELFEISLVQSCTHEQSMYPFSMKIPDIQALPWTAKTDHGKVEYGVKAVFKRPWFKLGDKTSTVLFALNSHLNTRIAQVFSKNPDYYNNVVVTNTNDSKVGRNSIPFCCWRSSSKEVVCMTLTIDSIWKFPGEEIPFILEVDNKKSQRNLDRGKIQLVGVWLHKGNVGTVWGTEVTKEKIQDQIVHEETLEINVVPGGHMIQKVVIKVPLDGIPTPAECGILLLYYKLQHRQLSCSNIGVVEESARFSCMNRATVDVDVLIGTLGAGALATIVRFNQTCK